MFRSKLMVPALSVMCLLGAQVVVPTVALASTARPDLTRVAMFSSKMVNVNLANNTGTALDIKVGETAMTIAAGQTVKVSAPAGTRITVVTAVATHAAGSVLTEISPNMSGVTIHVN